MNIYVKRIKKVKKHLDRDKAVLVLSSPSLNYLKGDQLNKFYQDSNIFYLTGSNRENLNLIISYKYEKPILIVPPENKTKIIWEGKSINPKTIANTIQAQLVITNDITNEILKIIKESKLLYASNHRNSPSKKVIEYLTSQPYFNLQSYPTFIANSDVLMANFRLYKDADEIKEIKQAISITRQALQENLMLIKDGTKERAYKTHLECSFQLRDAEPAFSSICAVGRSAATLHYHLHNKSLKKNSLFLVDCGALYNGYCADITRVFPIGGKFISWQKDLYQIVLEAQKAAINKIKDGVKIQTIYNASVKILVEGLKDLKILKGSKEYLIEKKKYLPYFPHGIGHSLGIDTHDVGHLRGNNQARLKKGMVFTVEPGLYFSSQVSNIPPSGIRIEDDILVDKNNGINLSKDIPKEINDIENWLAKVSNDN